MDMCNVAPARFEPAFAVPGQIMDRGLRPGAGVEPSIAEGDTVRVSREAILYNEALGVAQNAPDARADKVEAIRARIVSGAYEVDSRRIAESLLREEPALFAL